MDTSEEWTTAHDLALLYSGLAGIDRELTDGEVVAIRKMLLEWIPIAAETRPQEVLQDAARALHQSEKDIRRTIQRIGRQFEPDERRSVLRGLLRIAEADGVLIESERELIHSLADAWDLKQLSEAGERDSLKEGDHREGDWGMIHEIAFLFAQGIDWEPSSAEAEVIRDRLQEWRPALTDEEGRAVLRRALQAYADQSEEALAHDSAEELGQALPGVQKLLVIDDLYTIAQADGPPTRNERQHILSLADTWGINVRLQEED